LADRLDSKFWDSEDRLLLALLLPELSDMSEAAAQALVEQMESQYTVGVDWTLVNADAVDWARKYAYDLVKGIDNTTKQGLQRHVGAWIETPGATMGDLFDKLEGLYAFDRKRAKLVGVTEVTRAYAQGTKIAARGYEDAGLFTWRKTWHTNNDGLVCPLCQALHNESVDGLDTPFSDGTIDPPLHPNGRCWTTLEPVLVTAAAEEEQEAEPGLLQGAETIIDRFQPGSMRDTRRAQGVYDIISETDAETAKIFLTQGIEPSFKPDIGEVTSYAPGQGIERKGLYVANAEAFSKGSFGKVRMYLTALRDQLRSPAEMTQLGRESVDDVLGTENGAITEGALPKRAIVAIEAAEYEDGKWQWRTYTPDQYREKLGIPADFPKLPSVSEYRSWAEQNASSLRLSQEDVEDLAHDYNRGSLEDKRWLAEEAELI